MMCDCIARGEWHATGVPVSYYYRLPKPYAWDAGQTLRMLILHHTHQHAEYRVRYFFADGSTLVGVVRIQNPAVTIVDATAPKSALLVKLALSTENAHGRILWNLKPVRP